jgi:hypothetical protein
MLYSANDFLVEVMKIVGQNVFQVVNFQLAAGILNIQIDVELIRIRNYVAEQIIIHFVVKRIMTPLIVIFMIQFCFIVYNEAPEIEISRGKEKINRIEKKRFPGLGNLCPLQFSSCPMSLLQFPQCRSMLPGLFLGTPNGAKKHDRLVIVLQVTAFVTVNVNDFRHLSSPKMVFLSFGYLFNGHITASFPRRQEIITIFPTLSNCYAFSDCRVYYLS